MIHEFHIPDGMHGGELRSVVWDDDAGTVEGSHYGVAELRRSIAAAPLTITFVAGALSLDNPARSAPDFLALLWSICYSPTVMDHTPASLADVEPTPWVIDELPEGHVA